MQEKYVIPQLGETYNHEDYPVGSEVLLRLSTIKETAYHNVRQLETVFRIQKYITLDLEDDAYSHIELSWCPNFPKNTLALKTMSVRLQQVIHVADKEEYKAKDSEYRLIKQAMLEAGVAVSPEFRGTWEEWSFLEIDLKRKLALIKAGIHIENVHLYDELSVEELTSLKHHLRVLDK